METVFAVNKLVIKCNIFNEELYDDLVNLQAIGKNFKLSS